MSNKKSSRYDENSCSNIRSFTEEKLGKIINLAEKQDNESTDSFKITTVNAFISRLVLA